MALLAYTHLPATIGPLIGRERARRDITVLVRDPDNRLITLTGPGGVGKTRLALSISKDVAEQFSAGVRFVPLAPLRDHALILDNIAMALDVREGAKASLLDRLVNKLCDAHLMLVLDNFEHVIDGAPLVAELLASCPRLVILVTSRTRLRISGEVEYPVPPLALTSDLPSSDGEAPVLAEAVRLFAMRARAVQPGFEINSENTVAVSQICERLDGLPLAIELAASRTKLLGPGALLARLDRRLPLLTGGGRDQPGRQQTMRDAIAWSYDLLSPSEQVLFERLAVFAGGFSLEAAQAVADDPAVLDGVGSLLDNSLVRQENGLSGDPRFGMLETIREFGLERLEARGTQHDAITRLAVYFLELAERAEPELSRGEQIRWLDRLTDDHDNLRVALDEFARNPESDEFVRLTVACAPYWYIRGHIREAWERLNQAIELAGPEPTLSKGKAFNWLSQFAMTRGDHSASVAWATEGLLVWQEIGDEGGGASALHTLAMAKEQQQLWPEAERLYSEELAIWHRLGEPGKEGRTLALLSGVAYGQGNFELANERGHEAKVLCRLGGNHHWAALCDWYLGMFASAAGKHSLAADHLRKSFVALVEIRDSVWRWKPLVCLAATAAAIGRFGLAARLIGAADAVLDVTGARLLPFDTPFYEQAQERARASLGEEEYAASHRNGCDLNEDELLQLVDEVTAEATPTRPIRSRNGEADFGLTARELDVLRLLVQGNTDREIAELLFIGPRTVQTHTSNLYGKLGVKSRAEATAIAVRKGLVVTP